jgi:hypothetical protein
VSTEDKVASDEKEKSTTTTTTAEPVKEAREEPQKKRGRNPNLSDQIGNSKRQKEIKISHVSSVPQNANLNLTSNAFAVLGGGSSKKKKKKGNNRRNND